MQMRMLLQFFLAAVITWVGVPVRASQQTVRSQQDELKELDEFFDNQYLLRFSGCDQAVWTAIHQAVRADLLGQTLPEPAVGDDKKLVDSIAHCYQSIADKARQANKELADSLIKSRRNNRDAEKYGNLLFVFVNEDVERNLRLLDHYITLNTMEAFAIEAMKSYESHADDTRYRNLVARYNALVDATKTAHLPTQPQHLHCESSTNPVTHVTQMDCQ